MATRFPIFRSLQRSIVGSIGVGKHKPVSTVTARQFQAKEADTNDDDEEKKYKEEVHNILPDGYKLNDDNKNQIIFDNPNTWPINTEEARQLRKEFAQEGFRKLYTIAVGQTFVAGAIDTIDENHDNSVHEGDEVEVELRQATGMEETYDHDSTDTENNQSVVIPTEVSVEDWVYLAQ